MQNTLENFLSSITAISQLKATPSSDDIIFTNDGSDKLDHELQPNPPIRVNLILCDEINAEDTQALLDDALEYKKDIPYVKEHLLAIFEGTDPSYAITNISIQYGLVLLGVTAKQKDSGSESPANEKIALTGNYSFVIVSCCQQRTLAIQQFYSKNDVGVGCSRRMAYRFENNQLSSIAIPLNLSNVNLYNQQSTAWVLFTPKDAT